MDYLYGMYLLYYLYRMYLLYYLYRIYLFYYLYRMYLLYYLYRMYYLSVLNPMWDSADALCRQLKWCSCCLSWEEQHLCSLHVVE